MIARGNRHRRLGFQTCDARGRGVVTAARGRRFRWQETRTRD